MPGLDAARTQLLRSVLSAEYVPHLPALLDKTKPVDQQEVKNLSRAFSAFAVSKLCNATPEVAAKSVVDDFDDCGIDAVYYQAESETLYLFQSKLKEGSAFTQNEALAFCQGVKKLLAQDFDNFNQNVQARRVEIEEAIENCTHINLVVANIGDGITAHARQAINELIQQEREDEERLDEELLEFDAAAIVSALQEAKAPPKVNADLWLSNASKVSGARPAYIGLVALLDLARLHAEHGEALYEKNIRNFLGKRTEVNASITQSLKAEPGAFFFLNNGVTLLCDNIDQKGTSSSKPKGRKFKLRGVSVINGAQTISTGASVLHESDEGAITDARVSITLIQADSQGDFAKKVTRARNHQNPVHFTNFVALHDEQERLRREIAYLGIRYVYKAEAGGGSESGVIYVDEAAQALALFQSDPRFPVWLKKEPSRFLDTSSGPYQAIFTPTLSAQQLVNAVRLYRYVKGRMTREAAEAAGLERLAYKHGAYALGWVLAKQVAGEYGKSVLFDENKLPTQLGPALDTLRQHTYDAAQSNNKYCGPLALFRNQSRTTPALEKMAIEQYALSGDPVLAHKRAQVVVGEPYPKALFDYVISKAPQIGNLT